ncbi:MAG: hypothetical protein JXA10_08010 [Anaerolineae bacterium]|nr:hypothetical protein [Anaerolineae bacterium]
MSHCPGGQILVSTPDGRCGRCVDPTRDYQMTEAFKLSPSLCYNIFLLVYLYGDLGSPISIPDEMVRAIVELDDFDPILQFADEQLAQRHAEVALSAARLATFFASPQEHLDVLSHAFEVQTASLNLLGRTGEAAIAALMGQVVNAAIHVDENLPQLSENLLQAANLLGSPVIQANMPILSGLFELEAHALQTNAQPLEAMRAATISHLLQQRTVVL